MACGCCPVVLVTLYVANAAALYWNTFNEAPGRLSLISEAFLTKNSLYWLCGLVPLVLPFSIGTFLRYYRFLTVITRYPSTDYRQLNDRENGVKTPTQRPKATSITAKLEDRLSCFLTLAAIIKSLANTLSAMITSLHLANWEMKDQIKAGYLWAWIVFPLIIFIANIICNLSYYTNSTIVEQFLRKRPFIAEACAFIGAATNACLYFVSMLGFPKHFGWIKGLLTSSSPWFWVFLVCCFDIFTANDISYREYAGKKNFSCISSGCLRNTISISSSIFKSIFANTSFLALFLTAASFSGDRGDWGDWSPSL